MGDLDRIDKAAQLDVLGRDLTFLAYKDKLKPIYRRQNLIDKMRPILSMNRSLLLVGKSKAGKNATVEGLVCEMVEENYKAYESLYTAKNHDEQKFLELQNSSEKVPLVYQCEPSSFQRDCLYVHDFETKFAKVIKNCQMNNAILFIDNIHLATYAGAVEGNAERTVANALKGPIEHQEILVIGATTPEGYNFMLNGNSSFTTKFSKIEVPETSPEETNTILMALRDHFESIYGLDIDPKFLTKLIDTADYLFPWLAFPGKAFEILKEIIAFEKTKGNARLTEKEVDKYILEKTGLNDFLVLPDKKINRAEIEQFFTNKLYEQDKAIASVCDVIMTFKAGLNSPDRPIAVLLFMGPSGVGKTELAKLLAEYLFGSQKKLLRFDMSEYVSKEGQEKLIGSRSQTDPGLLISSARANPFAVYLFDEIEKSNFFVFDIFLQMFGEGRITDPRGQTVYLTNSIIIMTSNIGADLYMKNPAGFVTDVTANIKDIEKTIDCKLKEHFRPEFINRISKIIYFKPLSKDGIRKVALKEVDNLAQLRGLKSGSYKIDIADDVMELIIKVGYSPEYGARPMQRAIKEIVVHPVAEKLASENIPQGAVLKLRIGSDGKPLVEVQ